MKRIKDIKAKILLTLGYLLCIGVLYLFRVNCFFDTIFNIPCIGCGMTRALTAALKFDFAAAFGYHKMFWSLPLLYLYFLFDGKLLKNKILNKALFIFIAAGFIVSWIIKLINLL